MNLFADGDQGVAMTNPLNSVMNLAGRTNFGVGGNTGGFSFKNAGSLALPHNSFDGNVGDSGINSRTTPALGPGRSTLKL